MNIRELLKLSIICNASNGNISLMKDNLILLYQKYPKYDNDINQYIINIKNNYLQLRNYLTSSNIFIPKKHLNNF